MKFSHKVFYGMTEMGKTAVMKQIAASLRRQKQQVIVYSGVSDLDWPQGCTVTSSVDRLEQYLQAHVNMVSQWHKAGRPTGKKPPHPHVFLDEARVLYARLKRKDHPILDNLFTMGRHAGFTVYAATQYPTSIPPAARVNCSECFCFRLGSKDHAKIVYDDFGDLALNGEKISGLILKLPQLEFLHIVRPDHVSRKRVTFR